MSPTRGGIISKRRQAVRKFTPQTHSLEERAGGSPLAVGAIAGAASGVDAVGQITGALTPRDEQVAVIGEDSDGQPRKAQPYGHASNSGTTAFRPQTGPIVELTPAKDEPAACGAAHVTSPVPGTIRPLTLASAPQPITAAVPSPNLVADDFGQAPGNGVNGPTPGAVQPAPVSPASSGTNGATTWVFQPAPLGPASNGNAAQAGYVATGGTFSPVPRSEGTFAGSGGSGSGTSTNSGAGSTNPSTNFSSSAGSSAGATTSSPGSVTITQPSGGAPIKATLKVQSASGGSTFIGAAAKYQAVSTAGTVTHIGWTISGNAYSNNTFSSTFGSMAWNHPTFTPPPAEGNNNPLVSYYWGEKPGLYTVSVTANIVAGDQTVEDTAKRTIAVNSPSFEGEVSWWPMTEVFGQSILRYNHYIDNNKDPSYSAGISWTFSSTDGVFAVEQLLTNAVWSEGSPTTSWYGPTNGNAQGTIAPFPLVDKNSDATLPWYAVNQSSSFDSPSLNLTTVPGATYAHLNDVFTDYVMFEPTGPPAAAGAIYVPLLQFSWSVHATATKAGNKWTATDDDPPGETSKIQVNRSWPETAMDAPASKYGELSPPKP